MIDVVQAKWGDAALKVAIVHTAALDAAQCLRDMARKQLNCAEIFLAEMSPTSRRAHRSELSEPLLRAHGSIV
jgi:hypothetical protein